MTFCKQEEMPFREVDLPPKGSVKKVAKLVLGKGQSIPMTRYVGELPECPGGHKFAGKYGDLIAIVYTKPRKVALFFRKDCA